ncbi:hypothetical protein [Fluviicola taffensis]|uniref:Lipoprotein n=1 Tax=Fluviicola taffensis (strain DSM 16823 / NCIMB 13979 / RW262) TaxID=755732 RepID=F2IDG2_FLUTR|nr:hypothetical protein [Fluviicola taffensis]AEA42338.1 hypothetical protein Fluta_0329 [Fluviicola taffensis DSM 16823]
MSKRGRKNLFLCFLLLLGGCVGGNDSKKVLLGEIDLRKKSISVLGTENDYEVLYATMSDTLSNWYLNNLLADTTKDESTQFKLSISKYIIDSLYAVNSKGNKLIGAIYQSQHSEAKIWSDEMREFFGAKINNKWYFWMGGSTPVARHDQKKEISYKELHSSGIGSINGYLDQNGNIRDEWFDAKFKSGRFPYEMRYKYKWILDSKRIDNEKDYWEYSYWKSGVKLWADKAYKDSAALIK